MNGAAENGRYTVRFVFPVVCAFAFAHQAHAENTDVAHALAGRYDQHHSTGFVADPKTYGVDDVAEIVPVSTNAAYVRVSLHFYNGHICSIWGIARAERDELVYRASAPRLPDWPQCVLTISHDGKDLKIDDDIGSCKMDCGMNGSLTNVRLPFSSRRTIQYMAKLKASWQYQRAMQEWLSSGAH